MAERDRLSGVLYPSFLEFPPPFLAEIIPLRILLAVEGTDLLIGWDVIMISLDDCIEGETRRSGGSSSG